MVRAGVRVPGGAADVVAGSGVLPRRGWPAVLAAGGLDGCGRAGRVRRDGGGPVAVPVRRSGRTAAVDRRPVRLNDCKADYAATVRQIMPLESSAHATAVRAVTQLSSYIAVI